MAIPKHSRFLWLAAALAATSVYFLSMFLATGGRLSLPLDDAFIFFQYARQFAAGRPFHYNGTDDPSGGATSVLTLIVDSIGYLVGFRGDGMIVFSFLLGAAGLFVLLLAAERLGRALGMRHPWWAPVFILGSGPLLWGLHAGMDLPFFVGPLLASVAAWAEERRTGESRRQTILWGAIAAASRPEGILFAALLGTALLLERRNGSRFSPISLVPLAAGLVPALLLLLFTGQPSPTSLQVKGVLGLPGMDFAGWIAGGLEYFASVVREIFFGMEGERPAHLQANNGSGVLLYLAPLTFVLFLAGIVPAAAEESASRRTGPSLLAFVVLVAGLGLASLVVPKAWHWHRYLMPYYALVLPFAAVGLERILGFLGAAAPSSPLRSIDRIGFFVYLTFALPGALYFLVAFAQNSVDIAFQQRWLAEWSRVNVPSGETIAVNDAGALRYYGNHPILDLEGLTSTALTEPRRHGSSSLYEALERLPAGQRPGFLIVYPNWYDAAFLRPHEMILSRRIMRQTIAGGNPMNVYRADWSILGSGDLPTSPELIGILEGRTLVDRLDVADLMDERLHEYRFRSIDGQYQGILEMQPADQGGPPVMDGGRAISLEERFRVKTLRPGRDVILVLRSRAGFRIRIEVSGRDAGEWLEPGRGGPNWTESSFTIPGGLVRASSEEIRIRVAEPHSTAYTAFHYWIYQ